MRVFVPGSELRGLYDGKTIYEAPAKFRCISVRCNGPFAIYLPFCVMENAEKERRLVHVEGCCIKRALQAGWLKTEDRSLEFLIATLGLISPVEPPPLMEDALLVPKPGHASKLPHRRACGRPSLALQFH